MTYMTSRCLNTNFVYHLEYEKTFLSYQNIFLLGDDYFLSGDHFPAPSVYRLISFKYTLLKTYI